MNYTKWDLTSTPHRPTDRVRLLENNDKLPNCIVGKLHLLTWLFVWMCGCFENKHGENWTGLSCVEIKHVHWIGLSCSELKTLICIVWSLLIWTDLKTFIYVELNWAYQPHHIGETSLLACADGATLTSPTMAWRGLPSSCSHTMHVCCWREV